MAEMFNAELYLEDLEKELFKDEEVKTESTVEETPSKDFVIECLEFAMNFDDEIEVVTEGFNLQLKSQYQKDLKEIRTILKSIKKHTKEDLDYKAAIEALDKLDKKIDKMIEDVKNTEGDTAATVFGILYRGFIGSLKVFAAALITLPIGGIGAWVAAIEHDIKNIMGLYSRIMDRVRAKEDLDVDDFNMFKNSIITSYKGYKKKIASMKISLQKKLDEEKALKSGEVKEKVNDIFEKEKLKLYEACSAGEITEDQREALLDRFKLISKVEESVRTNDITDDFSNKDKFDAVKKDIYERCAKGEFSIDVREDLVKEAYTRFMEGEGDVDKIIDNAKKKSTITQDGNKLVNDVASAVKECDK